MALDPVTAIVDLANGVGTKLIERLWPNPEQAEAAKIKLFELQQSGELQRMVAENDIAKAMLADVASARQMASAIATSENAPYLNKIISPVLSLIVVIGGGALLVLIPDAEVKYAVVTLMTAVLSYHFGTSAGSTKASQLFRDMVRKNGH